MLAYKNRLVKDRDFGRVKREGVIVQSDSFGLAILDRKDEEPSRFGVVVSTNISPLANKRNYIKRALTESLRQNMSRIKDGYDCVLLVKQSANKKYMSELMPEVIEAVKKAKLTK